MRRQSWSVLDILARIGSLGRRGVSAAAGTDADADARERADLAEPAEPRRNSLLIALAIALPYAVAAFWRSVYTPYPYAVNDASAALADASFVGFVCLGACYALRRLMNPPLRPSPVATRGSRRVKIALLEGFVLGIATAIAPYSWGEQLGNDVVVAIVATAVAGGVLIWLVLGLRIQAPSQFEMPARRGRPHA